MRIIDGIALISHPKTFEAAYLPYIKQRQLIQTISNPVSEQYDDTVGHVSTVSSKVVLFVDQIH